VVAGLLLGGFYAAVSLGVSLIFGLLDIANIAQPAFVILGSYAAYVMNSAFGLDPILSGLLFTPVFFVLGAVVYRVYYESFERRGEESLRGLVFFFGLLFIMEVSLSLAFGVDYRLVETAYTSKSIDLGGVGIAFRYLVPCAVGLAMTLALYLFLANVFGIGGGSFGIALITDHLFADEQALNRSVAIAVGGAAVFSALMILIALRRYERVRLEFQEENALAVTGRH